MATLKSTSVTKAGQFTLRRMLLLILGINLLCACIPFLSDIASDEINARVLFARGLGLAATICVIGALAGKVANALFGALVGVLVAAAYASWLARDHTVAHRGDFGALLFATVPVAASAAFRNWILSLFAAFVLASAPLFLFIIWRGIISVRLYGPPPPGSRDEGFFIFLIILVLVAVSGVVTWGISRLTILVMNAGFRHIQGTDQEV